MRARAGVFGLAFILSAWAALTLLMVQSSLHISGQSAQMLAQTSNYLIPQSTTVRLHKTSRDLVVPSWRYLRPGHLWSYVSHEQGIDPAFVPPLTDLTEHAPDWLEDKRIQPMMQQPLSAFLQAAVRTAHPVLVSSAYRSGDAQELVRRDSTKLNGTIHTDNYVARPGHSEHQLGLAVDLTSANDACRAAFTGCALQATTADWLAAHAHEYGFILRYPKGKESITGISNEPWHFRYVGKELASLIHEYGLTFDEVYRNLVSLQAAQRN